MFSQSSATLRSMLISVFSGPEPAVSANTTQLYGW